MVYLKIKFLLIIALFLAASYAAISYENYKVVKFRIEDEEQLRKCQEMEIMEGVSFKISFSINLDHTCNLTWAKIF